MTRQQRRFESRKQVKDLTAQRPWVVRLPKSNINGDDTYYAITAPSKNKAIWTVKRALGIVDTNYFKATVRHPNTRELKDFKPTSYQKPQ